MQIYLDLIIRVDYGLPSSLPGRFSHTNAAAFWIGVWGQLSLDGLHLSQVFLFSLPQLPPQLFHMLYVLLRHGTENFTCPCVLLPQPSIRPIDCDFRLARFFILGVPSPGLTCNAG